MLERLRLGNDNEDNIPPSDSVDDLDNVDSDDETYDPASSSSTLSLSTSIPIASVKSISNLPCSPSS